MLFVKLIIFWHFDEVVNKPSTDGCCTGWGRYRAPYRANKYMKSFELMISIYVYMKCPRWGRHRQESGYSSHRTSVSNSEFLISHFSRFSWRYLSTSYSNCIDCQERHTQDLPQWSGGRVVCCMSRDKQTKDTTQNRQTDQRHITRVTC